MTTQLYIFVGFAYVDMSNYVLSLGNFDIWLHNYDFSLRIPSCTARLGNDADFQVGAYAKIVQDGKNIFPCYVSNYEYDELKKEYSIKLTHIFGKLKEQKLLWELDADFDAQLTQVVTAFDSPTTQIKGYKILVEENTAYNPVTTDDWIAYVLYNFCGGVKYLCKPGNFANDYTAICRTMFNAGTEVITGSDTYQDLQNLGSLFDVFDYIASLHTLIVWDATNENFVFWPVMGWLYPAQGYDFSIYSAPSTNSTVKYQLKEFDHDKRVVLSGRTDNYLFSPFDIAWYLDGAAAHPWSYPVNPLSFGSESNIQNISASKFNHIRISYHSAGASIVTEYYGMEQLKEHRFKAMYNLKSYETNIAYDYEDAYYINIADIKAIFKNGIYNAEITLIEEV